MAGRVENKSAGGVWEQVGPVSKLTYLTRQKRAVLRVVLRLRTSQWKLNSAERDRAPRVHRHLSSGWWHAQCEGAGPEQVSWHV